ELGGRHPDVVDGDSVEPLGELPQSFVAPLAHGGDDLGHGVHRQVAGHGRTGQPAGEISTGATQVESSEHGGSESTGRGRMTPMTFRLAPHASPLVLVVFS